ncbi:periplasmic binding protein-like II [Aureobasidium pullulans]|uniref:Periplasmic binding protein-like II n=1 Tax=Aureobasidium pullulans TaxID=5580 RepID=A0A4V4I1C2_AURPU|nr:periplasmic binding protein-like II [Aureobasidium pullulans]TIA62411.1 periplasmic binding protein-like II [Aureobasidium pullulans]
MKFCETIFALAFTAPAFSAILPLPNSFPGHAVDIDNRTLDQIYAVARNETGELIVLWGGDEISQGDPTIAAWKARFPDVKLNLTVDVSKYHDSRVNRQYQRNGDDGADIAVLQTLHDFGRWKREGRLYPYKPADWDNTEVPSIFGELINPVWKSKLALTYPNDDDAITYLFSIIIENYGWEWFDTLLQQNIQWIRGTGQPADLISQTNTTRALSFTTNLNGAENLASKTPSDARVLWPQTGGIFATTSRPESAKLFMSWLVSDEYQQQFVDTGSYTVRKDLESTSGSVWDDKVTPLTQFATFMENRDLVEWWRLQFETSIGTAQGLSPVLSEYGRRTTL